MPTNLMTKLISILYTGTRVATGGALMVLACPIGIMAVLYMQPGHRLEATLLAVFAGAIYVAGGRLVKP